MSDINYNNEYKVQCRKKCKPKKSYKRGKTDPGPGTTARSISPDWELTGKIERRIQAKKDLNEDFNINDKTSNRLNERVFK